MNNVEVVFCFDTTGSMSPCISSVKKNVESVITPLFKEIPNLKIGIGANGDYCDGPRRTSWFDLSNNIYDICKFVRSVERTSGGDLAECYELVLHEAKNLNWSVNSKKVLVLIADDLPHPASYPMNTMKLDWRKEAKDLSAMGVVVYSVQCLSRTYATPFYKELAELTGGFHLKLDQFYDIANLIMAITLSQGSDESFERFENSIKVDRQMTRAIKTSFDILSGRSTSAVYEKPIVNIEGLEPVPFGRFQMIDVDSDCDIRKFVTDHGLDFQPGKGFYEFTKSEDIQAKKEVILRDKTTGDMFTGNEARNLIGIPFGVAGRIKPDKATKYSVFVQSTSFNRKLKNGTKFLYEVDLSK